MSKENSFDIVCKVELQEVDNAVNQALKEISQRFDLKGSLSEIRRENHTLVLASADEYKLKSVIDVLQSKLVKRQVPLKALAYGKVEAALGGTVRQKVELQQGIPLEKSREIVKIIKQTKLKVQAQIQEDQVRVSGKNKDDLQAVIKTLKDMEWGIELQFTNYR